MNVDLCYCDVADDDGDGGGGGEDVVGLLRQQQLPLLLLERLQLWIGMGGLRMCCLCIHLWRLMRMSLL